MPRAPSASSTARRLGRWRARASRGRAPARRRGRGPRPRTSPTSGVAAGQVAQPAEHPLAQHPGAGLQPLVAQHVEHREAGRGRDRVAAEGVEVLHAVLERAGDLPGVVTTAPSGWPLPIGFPRVTMSGTTPWVSKAKTCVPTRPKPTCTSSAMHTAPGASGVGEGGREVAVGEHDLAAAARQRLDDEGRRRDGPPPRRRRASAHVLGVAAAEVGLAEAQAAAVGVGQLADPGAVGAAAGRRAVELVRADVDQRRQVAVVGVVEHQHVAATGVGAGEAQREVVRLAPGVRQEDDRQRVGAASPRAGARSRR